MSTPIVTRNDKTTCQSGWVGISGDCTPRPIMQSTGCCVLQAVTACLGADRPKEKVGRRTVSDVLFMDRVLTECVILWYVLAIVMGDNGVPHCREWTMRSSGQVDQ